MPDLIMDLKGLNFFKNFSLKRIVEMLDKMELQVVQKKEILFFKPNEVYVLVSGNILMKSHEGNMLLPTTQAKF